MVNLKCINKGINVTWSWCYQNETLQWFWSKLLFLWKHIFWCISEYMKNSFEILKFPMGMEAWFSDLFLLSNRLALWVSLLQMFTPICIYGYREEILCEFSELLIGIEIKERAQRVTICTLFKKPPWLQRRNWLTANL